MKNLYFFLLLFFAGIGCRAEYRALDLYEMMIKAEKVVHGQITAIDSTSFTLSIEGSLTLDSGSIRVLKFKDWSCAARWTDYAIGQKVFLFLETWQGNLVSMSGGNEGELPILENSVFIHGFTVPLPMPLPPNMMERDVIFFEPTHFDLYGGKYFGIEWNLDDFIETIAFVRNCFDFEYGKYRRITRWKTRCSQQVLEQVAGESKIIKWICDEAN